MRQILVIDDDTQNIELIKALVYAMGYEVLSATHSVGAMAILDQHTPNLILLDLRVPGEYDGWQMAQHIKATPRLAHIPIIAISVPINPDDQIKALNAGCVEFFAKPFHLASLRKVITQYLVTA